MKKEVTPIQVEDKVCFLHKGKATTAPVYRIDLVTYKDRTETRYMVDMDEAVPKTNNSKFEIIEEHACFRSIEELIKSLTQY
jgi:hypothetical protein